MKKIIAIVLSIVMIFSICACGAKEAACNHEYTANVETKDGVSTVVLTCKNCGEIASANVNLPEIKVEVPVEVEKEVVKEVVKTVTKEVIKEVEVPVYSSLEEQMEAEDYDMLTYYITNYSKLNAIKEYILENYYIEVDDETLMQGVYDGLFDSLNDPYSEYVPASEAEEYYDTISNSYSGIGVSIVLDENGNGKIDAITIDSPAEKSGLKVGDVFVSVDGVSCEGLGLGVADYIRGEVGTTADIVVDRNGEQKEFAVTRQRIGITTVSHEVLETGEGYIYISGFDSVTNSELKAALSDLSSKGVKKFVLDLRDNGGGDVEVAQDVANQLMGAGTLCYLEDKNGNKEYYKTDAGRTSMKYVVLVNEYTASASEILTAGIQDNGEAKIVGTKTFGKGVIQQLAYVNDGSSIKLTTFQYFSPKGKAINKVGITPDYIINLTDDCFDKDGYLVKDIQLEKALEILR